MKQLVWVNDGYNLALDVGGERILYRPLLLRERKELMALRPNGALLSEVMQSRIVGGTVDLEKIPQKDWVQAFNAIVPAGDAVELQDAENLRSGVELELKYPHLNRTSCRTCQAKWFDPLSGDIVTVDGKPLDRSPDEPLLCQSGECPKGTPERPRSLSQKNALAWMHWQDCRASGRWPDDPIVQRNNRIITEALKGAAGVSRMARLGR